jgi:hypothetical protein
MDKFIRFSRSEVQKAWSITGRTFMVYFGGWLVDVVMARRKWTSNAFTLEMKYPCSCFSEWIVLKLSNPFVHLWTFTYPHVDFLLTFRINILKRMFCSKMWRRLLWSTVTALANGTPIFIFCSEAGNSVSFRTLVYCGSYAASRPGKLHYS